MRVLVSGCSGFVGSAFTQALLSASHEVVGVVREQSIPSFLLNRASLVLFPVSGIDEQTEWGQVFQNIDVVVHCASRAYVIQGSTIDKLAAYRKVDVGGTLRMAEKAADAGVKRFVFLSSIKVNGEFTFAGQPFSETSPLNPKDAYAQYKAEVEQVLVELVAKTGMEIVIIRPPLVYGPGVKGNFATMMHWVRLGLPLPLGAIYNQRSLVALDNLVSFMLLCADRTLSPKAANQVFNVADGEDVSTTSLLHMMAKASGSSCRLIPVPTSLLKLSASLLFKREVADRLLGNLQVNFSKARTMLGWCPVVGIDQQLVKLYNNND